MPPSDSSSPQGKAAEVLHEFLGVSHSNRDQAFEALCAANPKLESELRALNAREEGAHDGEPELDVDDTVAALSVFRRLLGSSSDSTHTEGASAGETIGDFSLISRIASGGQGEVWIADQLSLKRRVAFKLVRPDRINDQTLKLFAREARAGGRLAHAGIVSVYGYGEDNGHHWISQELIEGGCTLRDFIDEARNKEELPKDYYSAVATFLAELAEALHAAHTAGVIHRDIKPRNVLVTLDNHPKITDFGLARITDETGVSNSGDFAGTWLYMSPEQVTAKRTGIDHRTDIFSLGVVMYEMLALTRPFEGDTTHQVANKIVHLEPPNLTQIRSRVPRDLSVICAKALEKRKESRYTTAAEFGSDIRRHLSNEPIHAQPPTQLERIAKWMQRNPTKSVASAAASVAFVVISWLGLGLKSSNTALEAKTVEARKSAARADAQAAEAERKTTEVLRLSLSQDYEDLVQESTALWPAHPSMIGPLEAWIAKASTLTAELPSLIAKRDELRKLAIPMTPAEIQAARESHPAYDQIAPLRTELVARRAALAVRLGEAKVELPHVNWNDYPTDANGLGEQAWAVVALGRKNLGQETLGLALATRALEAASDDFRAEALDTFAWANFAVGDDHRALTASREALAASSKEKRPEFKVFLQLMESEIVAASSSEGLAMERLSLARLAENLATLEAQVSERRTWNFPPNNKVRARWWHKQISNLIDNVRSLSSAGEGLLTEAGISEKYGWSVPRRLAFAKRLQREYAEGASFAQRWTESLPLIAAAYPELNLKPQMGLVPIGPDPASKLWEFWDVQSGTEPVRNESGILQIEEDSGLVFVLLPRGKFWMGSQDRNPDGQNYSPRTPSDCTPVHRVSLSAFFMSKYEVTQGQWLRMTGVNPSWFDTLTVLPSYQHDLTHPVEMVSWNDCVATFTRMQLSLPSESQWEYAARAGTSSSWWTGNDRDSLRTKLAANLPDMTAARSGANWPSITQWPEFDDGFVTHAPVDTLAANAFGLHHVCGNLLEWCLDQYDANAYAQAPLLDPLHSSEEPRGHVYRGGSFLSMIENSRSALRDFNRAEHRAADCGARPVKIITP